LFWGSIIGGKSQGATADDKEKSGRRKEKGGGHEWKRPKKRAKKEERKTRGMSKLQGEKGGLGGYLRDCPEKEKPRTGQSKLVKGM